jgi:RNA polymerase sigma-70 factor (ECF subfamily)
VTYFWAKGAGTDKPSFLADIILPVGGRLARIGKCGQVTRIDAQQLRQLIDTHGAALTLFARQWCLSPEDAVQEALIELVRQNPAPREPVPWLYTTVRRRAMNCARAEHRRTRHQRQAGEARASWFLPADNALDEPIDWQQLLAELPRREREVLVARIWGELSFAQIAELVGRSTSAVHRHYQAALLKLKDLINSQHDKVEARR